MQVDEPALREGLPLKRERWQSYLEWAVRAFRCAFFPWHPVARTACVSSSTWRINQCSRCLSMQSVTEMLCLQDSHTAFSANYSWCGACAMNRSPMQRHHGYLQAGDELGEAAHAGGDSPVLLRLRGHPARHRWPEGCVLRAKPDGHRLFPRQCMWCCGWFSAMLCRVLCEGSTSKTFTATSQNECCWNRSFCKTRTGRLTIRFASDPAADVLTIENSRSGNEMIRALAEFGYSRDLGPGVYDVHR